MRLHNVTTHAQEQQCLQKHGFLFEQKVKGDSRDPQQWDPLMVSFPYYSHIFRDSYGSGMGIVWEAYHKGVPLLGVPENPIEKVYNMLMYPPLTGGR